MAVALRDLEHGRRTRPALRVVPPTPPTPRGTYWRRRAAILLLLITVALGSFAATRAIIGGPNVAAPAVEVTVVVTAGQTLWDLAGRYAGPEVDRSAWVAMVASRNGIDPQGVRPGTPVAVPLTGAETTARPR